MSKVTFVSALFDIDRVDGRKWDNYLKWFDITLKLKVPMVLFITDDLVEFVEERRKDIPTDIIIQTVEDIPYHDLKDRIQEILDSNQYKEDISDPDRIECQQAMYSVIQYSKFPWLEKAIDKNPYESEFFFWIDAGASRFFEGYDLSQEYPSKDAVESLDGMGERFLLQMNCDYYPDLYNADVLPLDYLYDNRSYVLGSMFGGHKTAILKVSNMIDSILNEEMIKNNSINNEQIALGYLVKKYPDDFAVYQRTNGKHMDIFKELSER